MDDKECATLMTKGELYYDYPNKFVRADVKGIYKGKKFDITMWQNFTSKTEFIYDRNKETCTKSSPKGDIFKPEIPKNSKKIATSMIGSQAVETWLAPEMKNGLRCVVSVTEGTCFLVGIDAVNATNHKFKMAQNFLNFLPEIPPHVFEIPDKCNHRRLHPVPIPMLGREQREELPFHPIQLDFFEG